MKKLKGLAVVVAGVVLQPSFRPTEIRLIRAIVAAVAAYLGLKGYQAAQ